MALDFAGLDDYFSWPATASIENLGPATWMFWLYLDAFTSAADRVWCKGTGVGSTKIIELHRGTTAMHLLVDYSGTDLLRRTGTGVLQLGRWTHWTVTWDGSTTAANAHIYKNAVEATYQATTDGTGTFSDAGQPGTCGAGLAATGDLDGKLAHMQVWNRVLSDGEIRQAMFLPGSVMPGLVQYYPLDYVGPNNGAIHDFSTFANHGTSQGLTVHTDQPSTVAQGAVPPAGGAAF